MKEKRKVVKLNKDMKLHKQRPLLMELFKQGYVYIWCPKCETTTLHEPIKVKVNKRKDVLMDRYEKRYKCTRCNNVQKFKVKKV